MSCNCYRAEKNYLGKIGICIGTKECESCSCGGDEAKCDFYDYVRRRAKKTTNADLIRSMTDEELAEFIAEQRFIIIRPVANGIGFDVTTEFAYVKKIMIDWLREEVDNGY